MQVYLKNINLLIVKIPCIIMGILMLCALALITNSQYTELISSFNKQCKQYDTSINLLLSKYHSKASLVTKNIDIIENLEIQNYPKIDDVLRTLSTSSYKDIEIAYIVNEKNEYFGRVSTTLYNNAPITYDNVADYGQVNLLYQKPFENSDGFFSLVYPLYDSTSKLAGGLVILFSDSRIIENIPSDAHSPHQIAIQSGKNSHYYYENNQPSFLYVQENKITVPGSLVTIALRVSILPVIKTVISMLLLFLLILAIFYMILNFFAYCVKQSISMPLEKMRDTIKSYTSSVTQNKESGSETNE